MRGGGRVGKEGGGGGKRKGANDLSWFEINRSTHFMHTHIRKTHANTQKHTNPTHSH